MLRNTFQNPRAKKDPEWYNKLRFPDSSLQSPQQLKMYAYTTHDSRLCNL